MNPSAAPARNLLKIGVVLACIALVLGAGWWWRRQSLAAAAGGYRTAVVDRGDIRVAVAATGTLNAISTVDVGSQISGQVIAVLADFNDQVRKGQVMARIDPSTYQAQIAQGTAAVVSARANFASAQATLRNAEADYTRKARLAQQQLIARSDADLARAVRDQARAQVAATQAQITQQQASTETARLNLQRAVIRSPVDGVVLTRTIEPGQTVAASLQAPVLFKIAEDLSKMEILLAVDEADIGEPKPGQAVSFTVDAFSDKQYRGKVQQVRMSATNSNNVITYPVVVAVNNADRTLLPGMTANAEIEVSLQKNVLRVPNAALRYRPGDDTSAADPPPASGGTPAALVDELPRLAQGLQLQTAQQSAFDAAIAAARDRALARREAASGADKPNAGTTLFGHGGGPRRSSGGDGNSNAGAARQRVLERLNQQFGAFRARLTPAQQQQWDAALASLSSARRAPIYLLVAGKPQQQMVRVGASDGAYTQVSGDLRVGDQVIIGAERAAPSS